MKNEPARHRAVVKRYAKKAAEESGQQLNVHHEQFAKAIGDDCWQDLVSRCEPVAPRKKALKKSKSTPSLSEMPALDVPLGKLIRPSIRRLMAYA